MKQSDKYLVSVLAIAMVTMIVLVGFVCWMVFLLSTDETFPLAEAENGGVDITTNCWLIKGDVEITPMDLLDMNTEELCRTSAFLNLMEHLRWLEGYHDPNEIKRIDQHLIDSLIPGRYRTRRP